jgi:hypothetical protein
MRTSSILYIKNIYGNEGRDGVSTTILILIIYVLVKCTIHAPFKIASTPLYMNKDLISILIPVSNSHTVNGKAKRERKYLMSPKYEQEKVRVF